MKRVNCNGCGCFMRSMGAAVGSAAAIWIVVTALSTTAGQLAFLTLVIPTVGDLAVEGAIRRHEIVARIVLETAVVMFGDGKPLSFSSLPRWFGGKE